MNVVTTVFAALLSFILLGVIACQQEDTPAPKPQPVPSYFTGYDFAPKVVDDDNARAYGSLCDNTEPQDLDLNVYEFEPDTNIDEDVADIMIPTYDEDGEPEEGPTATAIISVRKQYTTPEGAKVSDYDRMKRFVIDVEKNTINVLTIEKDNGEVILYGVFDTRNANATPAEICFKKP
ncbi:hypothetical protein HNV11_23755 (plasmid) [Spirosoma taeanense]|uniref:Uncharacterized protein n=1 Tax=Spirosoma taeanense TaxID=2735870 RepID=A0A6M5YGM4_9BACT|nr:hypothetical protein [Spirosoma taeanense]QJW92490.1 hypothetical protein HNV11_23755 [Spirosoma taeanense]